MVMVMRSVAVIERDSREHRSKVTEKAPICLVGKCLTEKCLTPENDLDNVRVR